MEATYGKSIQKLRDSFATGKTKSIAYRKAQLKGLLTLFNKNLPTICDALKKDLGKSKFEALVLEVNATKNEIQCALDNLDEWMKPERPAKSTVTMMDELFIYNDPLGVVLIIGAWNYPLNVTLAPLIGAIAAGNCAVIKPSELSPNSAKLMSVLVPRYLDPECFEVILGGPAETTALLHHRFDHIFYTGSTRVGQIIYEAAAKHLTPVTLELGGKSPVYVDDSANMSTTVKRILWGKCVNLGQTCIAPDYILCSKEVEKRFIAEAKKVLDEWYGGDAEKNPDLARIVNSNNFNRIKALINSEKVAVGGKTDESQLFIEPTILSGVASSDAVMGEEIFGPVLPIINVKNHDEAIEYINAHAKPLALYVFTTKKRIQDDFTARTSSGAVLCNDVILHVSVDTLPFGGVGMSGFGNYHGKFGFDTFTHKKACLKRSFNPILEKLGSARYPPYSEAKLQKMGALTKARKIWFPKTGLMVFVAFLLGGLTSYLALKYGSEK